jgi:two-component system sensor histidine kinase/response regulator
LFQYFARMKLSTPVFAFAGIVLAFVISLYISFLVVRNASSTLRSAIAWEAPKEDILLEAQHLLSSLEDAETGQRGYIITTQRDFLEPYEAGRRDAAADLDQLGAMTSDNATQQAQIVELRKVMAAQFAVLAETVARASAGNPPDLVAMTNGKRLMDRARGIVASIAGEERRLLAIRHDLTQRATERRDSEIVWLALVGSLIFFGSLLAVFSSLRSAARVRATGKAMAASEARLRVFLERAPAAVAIFDADMHYVEASRRHMSDFHQDEAVTLNASEASEGKSSAEVPEHWRAVHRRVVMGETLSSDGELFRHGDGSVDWLQWEMTPWRKTDRTIGGAILFSEVITTRKNNDFRRSFLLELDVQLRKAPTEALAVTMTSLGQHLSVSRISYGELDNAHQEFDFSENYVDGTLAAIERHRLSAFGPEVESVLRAGQTIAVHDFVSDPRTRPASPAYLEIGARSLVAAPLMVDGRLRAIFLVSHRDVRVWTRDEVQLIEEVAARNWSVVEQARVKGALERSIVEFRTLADGIPTLCWMAEPDGNIYWYNTRWYEYTGTTLTEMAGDGWRSVHDPAVLPSVLERWNASLATGEPFEMTFPIRGADGVFRPFMTRIAPVVGEDGRVRRWLGINTDVTKATDREIALGIENSVRRKLEERFKQVIESAPSATIMIDEKGTIELVNARAEAIFGYTRDELLGRSVDMLLPGQLRVHHARHRATFFASPTSREMGIGQDLFGRRKDGSQFYVEIGLNPMMTAEGLKVISSIADITKRKEIERALNDSEQQMRLMFDSIRDHAICMLDAEGRVMSWNTGAERLKGYTKEEIIGRHFSKFYLEEDIKAGKPERELIVAARDGHVEDEGLRARKNGSPFLASVVINAVKDAHGELRGFVKVTRDITERRQIETQLMESNERFAVAAEAASLGFWDFDVETRSVHWDDQMYKLRGMTRDRRERGPMQLAQIHADDRMRVAEEIDDAAAGTRSFDSEYRIVLPDGRVRHMKAAASLKCDPTGPGRRLLGVSFDITERKEAETKLVEANERFALAAEAAGLAFWDLDIETSSVHWDDQMFRLFGVDPKNGNDLALRFKYVHADDHARLEEEMRGAVAGTRSFDCEYRIVRPDGCVRHLKAAASVKRDSTGRGRRLLGVDFDITERKEAENKLIEANERFALAAEAASLGFWDLDIETGSVRWDDQMFRLFGLEPTDERARTFRFKHVHTDDRMRVDEEIRSAIVGPRSFDSEYRIVWPDGGVRHVKSAATLKRDPTGPAGRLIGVSFDITERKEAEDQLVEANERFALAAQAAGLGFWDYDIELKTSRWDDQMFRLCGLDRAEAEPVALRRGHRHPDDRARLNDELRDAAAGLRRFDSEYRVLWPDGRVRRLHGAASLKRDSTGRGTRLLGVSFDVTERREAELNLELARDAAEAANRAKSDFLAVMSHEIRTPMNGIMGMNALLLDTELTPRQRKMGETIRHSADSLLTIIDDILDISKLEAGKFDLEQVGFDLKSVLKGAIDLLAPRAEEKNLSFSADMTAISRRGLFGDPTRLRQIVLNLLSNAIKFTEHGDITVTVATSDAAEGSARTRFEVKDTGPGVNDEAKRRLFKPFEQADGSITRRFGGTGLGLSICKKLVELMGGEIGVTDRAGGGSVFWFEVVLPHAAADIDDRSEKTPEGGRSAAVRSGRILLAEDNDVNVEVATMILEGAGYAVDVAVDGMQAVDAFNRNSYDLVLMDVQMPKLDGLSAARQIRASERDGKRLPIIAMTANAMKEDRRRCIDAGMDDYLSKPLKPALLIETVHRWMDRSLASAAPSSLAETDPIEALPVLDMEAIDELASSLPAKRIVPFLRLCLLRADEETAAMARLNRTSALDEIRNEAHKLISNAGTFGARQVQQLATRLQTACDEGDSASTETLIDHITIAHAKVSAALRLHLASGMGVTIQ